MEKYFLPEKPLKWIWASDNNPARTDQIATFDREHPRDKLALDYDDMGMQKVLLQCSSGIGRALGRDECRGPTGLFRHQGHLARMGRKNKLRG